MLQLIYNNVYLHMFCFYIFTRDPFWVLLLRIEVMALNYVGHI